MRNFLLPTVLALSLCWQPLANAQDNETSTTGPIKVLLVAGGCCHDYNKQSDDLKQGIESRIDANVTVIYNPGTTTKTTFEIYDSADWAKDYDVIVHDECSADVTDQDYINRILDAHRSGIPAVNLHCAMHCYRWGNYRQPLRSSAPNAAWFNFIGIQSTGHGPQSPIEVKYREQPIVKGLNNWTTIKEELYNNVQVYDNTTPLAIGTQRVVKGEETFEESFILAWTNLYGPNKTKVFSTSLGHNNETIADPNYLDLVCRGLLWTSGRESITDIQR